MKHLHREIIGVVFVKIGEIAWTILGVFSLSIYGSLVVSRVSSVGPDQGDNSKLKLEGKTKSHSEKNDIESRQMLLLASHSSTQSLSFAVS